MKVKLLLSRAGDRIVHKAGDIVDLPNKEAKRLIDQGKAVPLSGKIKKELREG